MRKTAAEDSASAVDCCLIGWSGESQLTPHPELRRPPARRFEQLPLNPMERQWGSALLRFLPAWCHVPVIVLLETLQASPARIGSEDGKTLTQRISLPRDRRRSFRAYDAPRYKSLTDNPKLKPKRGTVCTRLHLETARNAQIGHVASVR